MAINKIGGQTPQIGPRIEGNDRGGPQKSDKVGSSQTFADFLGDKLVEKPGAEKAAGLNDLKFSAHAQARLTSRGIELSPSELVKMKEAIQRAGEKGSKESLILTDKAAFVVSVKNNTVITAVDRESMKDNIFTNIDSTIMI